MLIPSRFVAKAIRAPCWSASCARWARTPENIVEGVYAAFRQLKIRPVLTKRPGLADAGRLEVLDAAEQKAKAEAIRCKATDDGVPVPDIARATYGEK